MDIIGDSKKFTKSTDDAVKATVTMQSRMDKIKSSIVQGFGVGAGVGVFDLVGKGLGMVTDFMGDAGRAASDLSETQSKLDQVFKTQAGTIRAWAADSAHSMGQSTQAALEAAGTFGNFLQAMGQAEPEAAKMSTAMVQLAGDLGSFNNQDPTDVLEALRSGLSGETEPLRKFGVDISDAAVSAELLRSGIKKVAGQFTQAQKIQGRYNLIMKQTTTAQGDFARTADGTANAQRTAAAEIENAKAKMGEALNALSGQLAKLGSAVIPELVNAVGFLGDSFHNLQRIADGNLANTEDLNAAILAQAAGYGVNADAVIAYAKAIDDSQKAQSAHIQLVQDLQSAIGDADGALQSYAMRVGKTYDEAKNAVVAGMAKRLEDLAKAQGMTVDELRQAAPLLASTGQGYRGLLVMLEDMDKAFKDSGDSGAQMAQSVQDRAKGLIVSFKAVDSIVKATRLPWFKSIAAPAITAVNKAKSTITELAAEIPGSYAEGLRSQLSEVRAAAADLKWASTHPLYGAKTIAEARGILAGKALRDGLKSTNPAVRHQAEVTRSIVVGQLNGIADGGYVAGYDAGAALIDGLKASGVLDKVAGLFGLGGAREYHPPKGARGGHPKGKGKKGHKASGGPVSAGGTYLVGEKGPELVTMGGNGHVTPNNRIGGNTFHVTVNVAPGADPWQTGKTVVDAIKAYERRSGSTWRAAA